MSMLKYWVFNFIKNEKNLVIDNGPVIHLGNFYGKWL